MSSPPLEPDLADPPRPRSSLRAISLLSGGMFVQFALQFVYQLLLAKWFGAQFEMDAFLAAQTIPIVASTILVGSLQYAFVPVFVQRREQFGPAAAWEFAGTVGAFVVCGIALLSLAGWLAAGPIIRFTFHGYEAAKMELTISLFRIMVWLTWTISVTAFFQTVLQSAQVYTPAAVGPLAGTVVTFVASWLTYQSWGIHGIAWSTLGGAMVALLWQAPVYCLNARYSWKLDDGTRHMLFLLVPLLMGAAIYKLDPLLDRYLASDLPDGNVSRLTYASRMIAAFLTLTSNGLAMVVFPVLATHAANNQLKDLKSEVGHALQFLIFLLLPLCAALACFPVPLIRDLFERGKFTPDDTIAVAELLALSVGILIGGSLGEILSKTFFALGDTRTPTVVRMVGFLVGAGLKLWWGTRYGLTGLVWATSSYYLLIAGLDWILLSRRVGAIPMAEARDSLWKSAVGACLAILTGSLILSLANFQGATAIAGMAGGVVYLLSTCLLRESISIRLWRGLATRFR